MKTLNWFHCLFLFPLLYILHSADRHLIFRQSQDNFTLWLPNILWIPAAQGSGPKSAVRGPVNTTTPKNVEMHQAHPDVLNQILWRQQRFTKPCRWFWRTLKSQNHWLKDEVLNSSVQCIQGLFRPKKIQPSFKYSLPVGLSLTDP